MRALLERGAPGPRVYGLPQALVVPSAPECFEQIDLNLDQAGIGRGDRCV